MVQTDDGWFYEWKRGSQNNTRREEHVVLKVGMFPGSLWMRVCLDENRWTLAPFILVAGSGEAPQNCMAGGCWRRRVNED